MKEIDNNTIFNEVSVGILAAEKSRRMNVNKALLKLGDKTFIEHLFNEFSQFDDVIISARVPGSYLNISKNVVYDSVLGVGPMEGILQILKSSKNKYSFVCSVDMPFLGKSLLEYLWTFVDGNFDCYVFKDDKRCHPTLAIYSKDLIDEISNLIKEKKFCLLEIYERSRVKYVEFPTENFDKKIISNINTMEDYNNLCQEI